MGEVSHSMHATDIGLAQQFANLIHAGIPSASWRGLDILDFGAGEGDAAAFFRSLGAQVAVVEPHGFRHCAAKGLTSLRSLQEIPPHPQFDGIVMTEVVEHLTSPLQTFRELNLRLKKGGWIFVTTPNSGSLRATLAKNRWSECRKFGHLFLFSRRALRVALRAAGFQMVHQCRGIVQFSRNPFKFLSQVLLQMLRIDGQLRFLAVK
jgi:2-polyprenyl-3-methyl-5-hydroxy-6-metoxy-1,4-benzoquinol methylase